METKPKTNWFREFKTMGIVLFVIALLNIVDHLIPFSAIAYMTSVLTSTSLVLFIAAASHLTRKVFFPNISLTEYAQAAKDHPQGAAMVFMGGCVVLATLILAQVALLAR